MRRSPKRFSYFLAAMLGASLASCATEPDPLDRTQPTAVPKAIFTGNWLYNVTVTDAEYDNRATFIGEETNTHNGKAFKVRWEITEDRLTGYMVPQVLLDSQGKPVENSIGPRSAVLSFPIKKHYDIRYRYNSTTREELNVIEENTDRPWYERQYMEVDWSQNSATNIWNPTSSEIETGDLVRENVSVYENVEFFARGPDRDNDIKIDTRKWSPERDPEVYAINIDTKESIGSKLRSAYQLYYGTYMQPSPVRFRHSLLKEKPAAEQTYKPMEYRDELFRRFGFFRTEFNVWDENRHYPTESEKRYLIHRWDLSGNKQIVWYMSPAMQEIVDAGDTDIKVWAQDTCDTWNATFQEATGRTDRIVVLKENEPLLDADGKQVTRADGTKRWKYELGDLRYPMINVTNKKGKGQPCGYGPSTPHPDTGEIIHGTVNIYGGDCYEWVVQRALDYYDVASGHCTLEDVKNGRYFNEKTGKCDAGVTTAANNGPAASTGTGLTGQPQNGDGSKKQSLHFMSPALQTAYWSKADITMPMMKQVAADPSKLKARYDFELKHPTMIDLNGFRAVAGSARESSLLPQGNLGSLMPYATSAQDPAVVEELSPAKRLGPEAMAAFKTKMINQLMTRDEPDMFEPGIHAFVSEMKGKSRAEVIKTLRHWTYFTAMLHEMGHTLGLRHNFMGSVDQRNFPAEHQKAQDEYWTQVEALRAQYQTAINKGDSKAYKEYVQKVDDLPSVKDRYGSSSIMEYVGEWVDWGNGTRPYDRAAILLGYGNKVEVKNSKGGWDVVPYKDGDFDQTDPLSTTEKAKSGRQVRYYLFCSDEKTFDDAFCSTFDRGVTATEITQNYIADAQVSYFFRNFKRDSVGFDNAKPGYYMRKWMYEYYVRAKPLAQLSLNSIRYPEFWSSVFDGVNAIAKGPESRTMKPGYYRDGGEDLLRASLLFYYYLIYDVLGRPDYGYYQLERDTTGQEVWTSTKEQYLSEDKPSVFIDAGGGWGFNDRWDIQNDPQRYYEHLQRIGVELDKVVAMEVLSIPAALNQPLYYEKANGTSYWNALWTNNGQQLWEIFRGLITDNFSHRQNPWCMKCDAACKADPKNHPPELRAYPVDYLEGLAGTGVLVNYSMPTGQNRCGVDEQPVAPGYDALFAIKPMFYAISGASHPWYHNALIEHLDSQVKGGNHRFDIPEGKDHVEFTNPMGTKTYQAVQTDDKLSVSYTLIDTARRIRNRVDLYDACAAGKDPKDLQGSVGTNNRTCSEVLSCFSSKASAVPAWCEPEGWSTSFAVPALKYSDLDRIEAMLIMMQDMIDLTGHYAWRVPGYMDGGD